MDPEAAYLEAALPEPVTILQQRLRPFSIGHWMHLARHRNPFIAGGIPLLCDLYQAVFFCSQEFSEGGENLEDPKLPEKFKAWAELVGPVSNEFELFAQFYRYIGAGMKGPNWAEAQPQGRRRPRVEYKGGAPLALALQNTLTGYLGFSPEGAANCAFGDAKWRYCAYWESQGRIRIVTDDLELIRAEAAKRGWELWNISDLQPEEAQPAKAGTPNAVPGQAEACTTNGGPSDG